MNDQNLGQLLNLENQIYELSSKIGSLLDNLKDTLNNNCNNLSNSNNININSTDNGIKNIANNSNGSISLPALSSEVNGTNLEDIFKLVSYVRDEMHKQVEDVYKEGNYYNLSKVNNDLLERINYIKEIKK